jgi:hypothetical protein
MDVLTITTKIEEARRTDQPRYGMARDGYTKRSGAPTSVKVRLAGERRWRRLMVWQFSNSGTCFLRMRGREYVVPNYLIPDVVEG